MTINCWIETSTNNHIAMSYSNTTICIVSLSFEWMSFLRCASRLNCWENSLVKRPLGSLILFPNDSLLKFACISRISSDVNLRLALVCLHIFIALLIIRLYKATHSFMSRCIWTRVWLGLGDRCSQWIIHIITNSCFRKLSICLQGLGQDVRSLLMDIRTTISLWKMFKAVSS